MPLKTVNLAELANQIKKPFDLLEAAQVDELGIYLYASHGRIGWHRHVDEDELFLVLNGMVSFDSERGSQSLHVGELLLMPKGVGHRSSSLWRSTVLLVRPRVLASVQNGQRQLFALPAESKLPKKTLSRVAAGVLPDFSPHELARLGAYQVDLIRGVGVSRWLGSDGRAHGLLVHEGKLVVEMEDRQHRLAMGELAVLSASAAFRLIASTDSVLLHMAMT